jgi:PKD repeat protein
VPEGWIIHDVNNTGSTFSEESTQGYGILAQLCPQEEGQGQGQGGAAALSNNVSRGGGGDTVRCQGSEGDIIHIVRYPDLDTRLQVPNNITTTNNNNNVTTIDNILLYHMQKLEEVGYRNITIVNSTYTAVNIINPQTNQTISIVPAKTVEMKYRTSASAPNEIREGYFILTATNATHPNVGMTKGYSIFYEGTSTAASAATAATIQETTTTVTPSGSLPLPPAAVRQVFDSFELIAAQEVEEPTNPLTVEITSSDTEGGEIAPATFEFEAGVAGGTEPYTYSWDFDGEGSGESNEQTVSHTFEEDGRYNVRLTVTDSIGQSASDSMEITVEEAPAVEEEVEDEVEVPAVEEEVEEVIEEVEEEEQPPAVEEEEEQPPAVEEDNNSGSDDLIDVDDFLDDLFDRLGLDN